MYPIMLDLRGRTSLVVGAGQIALRKLLGLLAEGAVVTVVAPKVIVPINRLARDGEVKLIERHFLDSDLDGMELVLLATGDRQVEQRVSQLCKKRKVWVNAADVPALCDFHLPSVITRGDLRLCLASGGGAPFAVRRLRELLEYKLGPTWGVWMTAARRFRGMVRARGLGKREADACFDRFFAETVDIESLAVRVPSEQEQEAWLLS